MNESQEYCINYSQPGFQSNNSVTIKVDQIDKDCEPPAKKRKLYLSKLERVSMLVQTGSTDNLKSALSANVSTTPNSVINQKYSIRETTKEEIEVSSIPCQTENYQLLSILDLANNTKAMKFYTGFKDYDQFFSIFGMLSPDKYNLKYYYNDEPVNLSHLDQFLLVLILLKQHKSHYEISIIFNVTLKDIKNIFITWIRFMKLEWSRIKIGKAQKLVKKIAILNNNTSSNNVELGFKNKDGIQVIVLENDKPDLSVRSKKIYKILLDGPANYIESHLVNDIKFVCERLCYLTIKKDNGLIRLKPLTKKIVQSETTSGKSSNDCENNVSFPKKAPKVYKKVCDSISYFDSGKKVSHSVAQLF